MRFVYGHDEIVARFVQEVSPNEAVRARGFGKHTTIGVIDREGLLVGGFVFHDWSPETGTIVVSGAGLPGRHWFTRDALAAMFDYCFERCGCQMLIKCIPDTKAFEGVLLALAKIGYAFVRVQRMYGRDCDGIIATFTAEDWATCRFNRNRVNKPHPLDIPDYLRRVKKEAA